MDLYVAGGTSINLEFDEEFIRVKDAQLATAKGLFEVAKRKFQEVENLAKKSSTIHVEEFVWKEIENIQKNQNITSRNTAIEYLVAEYRGLKKQAGKLEPIVDDNKGCVEKQVEKTIDPLAKKLNIMEDDMPDQINKKVSRCYSTD